MFMDYGALPPEINSGRLYAGPGSGSLLTAAAAWDELATELHSTASIYQSVISGLTGGAWMGPSSAAMAAAAESYVAWLHTTAAQAEQTASQAKAAASAHSTALTATVPPPVVAANRSLLMALIATNFFGQNAPAIGETERMYAEMWAQDAAAMYGYAGSSAAASMLTPFGDPPQTTNPGGQAAQAGSVLQATGSATGTSAQSTLSQLTSPLSTLLSPVTSAPGSSPIESLLTAAGYVSTLASFPEGGFGVSMAAWAGVANLVSNINNGIGMVAFTAENPAGLAFILNPPLVGPAALAFGGSGLSASFGEAVKIGALSVPQGWAMPAPAITPAAVTLPANSAGAAPAVAGGMRGGAFGETMLGTLAGRALGGVAARAVVSRNRKVVPRSPAAG